MRPLTRKEDPTGFLSMIRFAASDRFGDPRGVIQGRGVWHHVRKKGPGRANLRGVEPPNGERHGRVVTRANRFACLEGAKWLRPNVMRRGR